jgi:hypothetical protein
MGYYKQQEISEQDYVPERIPRPRPASSHVALTIRRRDIRSRKARTLGSAVVILLSMVGMFVLGVVLGVMA